MPDDPRRDHSTQIVHAGQRAKDLVRQLLAFSSKQTLVFKPIDLNVLLENFAEFLRRTVREDVEFNYSAIPGDLIVNGDTGQLEQVIMNLVVNAQDAMPHGGELSIRTNKVNITEQDIQDE